MKRLNITLLLLVATGLVFASAPKQEFRASWVATVWGIDWPKTQNNPTAQKAEMDNILDRAKAGNLTAVMLQVRGFADAIYNSQYEPWSSSLTGIRDANPGWDPLAYAIEQAHARGLELHAWINPYRVGASSYKRSSLIQDSWLLNADGTLILDPGNPAVREYNLNVVADIIDHYDIDGLVFDDYFYKSMPANVYKENETQRTTANNPHNLSLGDWRRENVNIFVGAVMDLIKEKKPYLRFGIGPAGVWSTQGHNVYNEDYTSYDYISACPGSWDVYSDLYCDAAAWLKRGYIDYISPQLYWPMLSASGGYYSSSSFDKLCPWWAALAKRYNRHFYVSQDVADNNPGVATARFNSPAEIDAQMGVARAADKVQGHVFYNTSYFLNLNGVNSKYFSSANQGFHTYLPEHNWFDTKSLAPAITWREAPEAGLPVNLQLAGTLLTWEHATASRFTVYVYPKGIASETAIADPAYLMGVTYSKTFDLSSVPDLEEKTIAVCVYDRYGNEYAPVLLNDEPRQPAEEGETDMEMLWSRTQAASGYLATGNANRSMAYYDGALYIPDQVAGKFSVVDAQTGDLLNQHDIAATAFWQHNCRITPDGQMLFGNSGSGAASMSIYSSSVEEGGAENLATLSLNGLGRTDYFYTYGEWNDSGFLLAMSNTGSLLKIPFEHGTLGAAVMTTHSSLPNGTSAKAIPADANTFYASASNRLPTRHAIATGQQLESFNGSVVPGTTAASGLATFALHGHKYMVLPHDAYGSFEVYEVTDGLTNATKVTDATPALGNTANAAYTVDFCTYAEDDDAYIYVLAPNNGVAAYRFTFTATEIPTTADQTLETDIEIRPLADGVSVGFSGTHLVEIYNINGLLLDRSKATDAYRCTLSAGLYIIKIDNNAYKFVK